MVLQKMTENTFNNSGEHQDSFAKSLFVKQGNSLERIEIKTIDYLQSDGNYVCLFVNDRKFMAKISLSKLMDKLPSTDFVRVHHRYVVRKEKIAKIDLKNNSLNLGELTVPLGRSYKPFLLSQINKI